MADPTTTYGWNLPTVGGDSGAWGTTLNGIFQEIDDDLAAVDTVADAALPKAGGTMTGNVKMLTERFGIVNMGSMTGAVTLNLALGNVFIGTLTGNVTISFSNPPAASDAQFFAIELTQDGTGGRTVTWPSAVRFTQNGHTATTTATLIDTYAFYTLDGGDRIRGALILSGMSA